MILHHDEHIVTAYTEHAAGPGWANSLVWVIVRDGNGKLREESLQPEEQSKEMALLFSTSCAAHQALVGAVERHVKRAKKPRKK